MKEGLVVLLLLAGLCFVITSADTSGGDKPFFIEPPPRPSCTTKKINVIFLVENFFFSALWNAHDISHFFATNKDRYPDIQTDLFLDIASFQSTQRENLFGGTGNPKQKADLCVFLKSMHPDPSAARKCKRMGAKIATLLDDIIPSNHMDLEDARSFPWLSNFDYVIAVNSFTRAKIQEYVEKSGAIRVPKVWVLPVHHTNYHDARHPDPSRPVKVIGWQGSKENGLSPELAEKLRTYCSARGIEFREEYFPFPGSLPSEQRTVAGYQAIIKSEFEKIASTFDIYVLFPPPFSSRFSNLLFKSASRFLFSLSMGLPTVAYPFYSYLEAMAQGQEDYPAMASSEEELFRWLDYLIANKEARMELSRKGLKLAERFEIGHVMDMWANELRTAFCKASRQTNEGQKDEL